MVNINKLRGKMVELGYNMEKLANEMQIDKCKLYRRFTKPETFTIKEVNSIISILNLSSEEIMAIFFKNNVA